MAGGFARRKRWWRKRRRLRREFPSNSENTRGRDSGRPSPICNPSPPQSSYATPSWIVEDLSPPPPFPPALPVSFPRPSQHGDSPSTQVLGYTLAPHLSNIREGDQGGDPRNSPANPRRGRRAKNPVYTPVFSPGFIWWVTRNGPPSFRRRRWRPADLARGFGAKIVNSPL